MYRTWSPNYYTYGYKKSNLKQINYSITKTYWNENNEKDSKTGEGSQLPNHQRTKQGIVKPR